MANMTITEALAEVKLIDKKVEKKQQFISSYAIRANQLVDPLADSGGSRKVLEQERQAVFDLLERKVAIRRAIQAANAGTSLTIGSQTRSISDWLVWRREVAPAEQAFLTGLKTRIDQARTQATQQRVQLVAADKSPEGATDILVNLSEKKLAERAEEVETALLTLDGQLSLKNALITIDF